MQHYGFMLHSMVLHHGSFLIRKSADIMLICSSPRLIAACHVLHRLLMPRHSPYALVRLNFLYNVSHYTMVLFELSEFLLNFFVQGYIDSLRCEKAIRLLHFVFEFPPFGEIVFPLQIWKDSIISYFVLFCSFSYSNLSSIRLSKIRTHFIACSWSVWMDSNHRPRAYQARALAT